MFDILLSNQLWGLKAILLLLILELILRHKFIVEITFTLMYPNITYFYSESILQNQFNPNQFLSKENQT